MSRTSIGIMAAVTALSLFLSCGGGGGSGQAIPAARDVFPAVQVPVAIQDGKEAVKYAGGHYWDAFFNLAGVTDSTRILGLSDGVVEQALANFIGVLDRMPKADAQKCVEALFSKLSDAQSRDTSSFLYLRMTEKVTDYLYDPNSPLRDEDLFLPFVKAMASSPYTRPDMVRAYQYQTRMCSLNRYGEQVPDFTFRTLKGRNLRLHGIKADYTMLFFSNPGCHSCKGIIDEVMARPYMESFLASGKVAVVNVYIDEDIQAWKDYAHNYPDSWYSGYDPRMVIRGDELYCVRAIPSLYLLDAEKRVIMKDAPTERVLAFLDRIEH